MKRGGLFQSKSAKCYPQFAGHCQWAKSEIIIQSLLLWKCQVALFIQEKSHSQIWSQGIPELTGRILLRSDCKVWNKIVQSILTVRARWWWRWSILHAWVQPDYQTGTLYHAGSVSVQMTTPLSSLSTHWHCLFHCSWSVKRRETMELKLLFEKGCFWWNLQTISFTL